MASNDDKEDLSLRVVAEDPKKMKPPNKKKFDEEMETLQSQIKEKEMKYEKLKSNFSEIKNVEAEKKATIERRKRIVMELEKLNKDIPGKMWRLNELKSSLVYKQEDKINNAISRLEWNLSAKTFKLTEEKKIVTEIDRLKRSKKTLVQYQTLEQEINGIRDKQRGMRDARDALSRTISHLKSKEDSTRQNYQKSKVLKQEIDVLYEQKRQLVASFKRQKEDFKDVKDKQRKESLKKKEEDRRAYVKVKRQERVEMEADKLPHENELHLCQTLITYLSRFGLVMQDTSHEGLSPASSHAEDPEPAEEMDDGQFVLLRKNEDNEDLDLSIGLGRNRRKNRRSRKQSMIKKITHSTDVLSQFVALNVNAPSSLLEVAEAIDELKKRKAFYEGEQQRVESASDAGFSLTESMMCEMSRQASKTESCEGGSQENVRPDESVYTDLLQACKDDEFNMQQSVGEELLGAVGGVAESECSDSATPKSDSQNSDSTVEGESSPNECQISINNSSLSPSNKSTSTAKAKLEPKRNLSPKGGKAPLCRWPMTGLSAGSDTKYLAVPNPDSFIRQRSDTSPFLHKSVQKAQSLQPVSTSDVKTYAHSVVSRTRSFSSAAQYKKSQVNSTGHQQSHQPSPPSSLSLNVPLSQSLNLPSSSKRPLSRSKIMTPTEGKQWRDQRGFREEHPKPSYKTTVGQSHQDHKSPTVSTSLPHPFRSPLSPRHSLPLLSDSSALQSTPTVLDQDFPPLSQTTNPLRRSSNLSSKSSNGSLTCPDHSHEATRKPSPTSTPSSSKKTPQNQTTAPLPQDINPKMQQASPASLDLLSSVKKIPSKGKSDTELWVEKSIAFVPDETVESESTPPLRESTRL